MKCCDKPEWQRPDDCIPIPIPEDDPFWAATYKTCMELRRSMAIEPGQCRRSQLLSHCVSVCMSTQSPSCLPGLTPFCMSDWLYAHLSVCLTACQQSSIDLSVCLAAWPSDCLCVCLPICLLGHLFHWGDTVGWSPHVEIYLRTPSTWLPIDAFRRHTGAPYWILPLHFPAC